jgi:5-bromo-4-chloroindolyl phosphate hydrolysis protein
MNDDDNPKGFTLLGKVVCSFTTITFILSLVIAIIVSDVEKLSSLDWTYIEQITVDWTTLPMTSITI